MRRCSDRLPVDIVEDSDVVLTARCVSPLRLRCRCAASVARVNVGRGVAAANTAPFGGRGASDESGSSTASTRARGLFVAAVWGLAPAPLSMVVVGGSAVAGPCLDGTPTGGIAKSKVPKYLSR